MIRLTVHEMDDAFLNKLAELKRRTLIGRHDDALRRAVAASIDEYRDLLAGSGRGVGPWVREELACARQALSGDRLSLALTCLQKAVEVHGLSPADYNRGFHYSRTGGERTSEHG